MYRQCKLMVAGGYDSTLVYPVFGPLNLYFDQTADLQSYSQVHQLKPTDTEFTVPLSTSITTVNFLMVASDYPVLIRLVNNSTTQIQMRSNNVAVANVGSPLPDQCVFIMSATLPNTYLAIAPISGAVSTANVKVFATGDPQTQYV